MVDVTMAKEWAALVQSVFTSAAILVGGVWAYFRFFKDRTYRPRLEPAITGKGHPAP